MLTGLNCFSNYKVLFFNCFFYIFYVANDLSLYLMKKKVIMHFQKMLKIF